jgi:uncharacterized membrane protein
MNLVLATSVLCCAASISLSIWVARTLHRNGRIFLIEAFRGTVRMADALNDLLVVGFYLINLGFILLFLKQGAHPGSLVECAKYLAPKLGIVLLVLGVMHFFNMFNFNSMRQKGGLHRHPAPPPLEKQP